MSHADLAQTIDAAWEARAEINPATTGRVREAVDEALFEATCREAASDAGLRLRVLDRLGQARDHPTILTVPETRYLKGLLLDLA